MKILFFYFIFFIPFYFSGCIAKNYSTEKDSINDIKLINGKIKEIKIKDERIDISDNKLKVPLIIMPGKQNEITPSLKSESITKIKDEINRHFNNNTDTIYTVEFILKKGKLGYIGNSINEIEFIDFQFQINLIDNFNKKTSCESEDHFTRKVKIVKSDFLYSLYEVAFLSLIQKCFKKLHY